MPNHSTWLTIRAHFLVPGGGPISFNKLSSVVDWYSILVEENTSDNNI